MYLGSESLVEFLQRWKVTHLELMTHYWGASNHAAATKLEKAMLIESYLTNGYINYGDPNVCLFEIILKWMIFLSR